MVGLISKFFLLNLSNFSLYCSFIFLKDYLEVIRCLGRSQDPKAVHCVALAAQIAGKKEIYEKSALSVCANDIKMAEKFAETILVLTFCLM